MAEKLSNPAPLGLMGFGMTTVLLNIHNAGFFPASALILAMGIFYGGMAQIIAGVMEFRKGNTFGTTAFTSYGLFWLSLVFILISGQLGWFETSRGFLAWYLFFWGLFTFAMMFGTLKKNVALFVVFLTLTILFWLLAAAHWLPAEGASILVTRIAGWEGIVCGLSAIYLAMAEVLNENLGKTVLPICPFGNK
ncbi:acetate uptake transporter [candidate division WOR-3 bacterium]|nr:acetate uptake transporter [candidate division WOR-3 bacterium]